MRLFFSLNKDYSNRPFISLFALSVLLGGILFNTSDNLWANDILEHNNLRIRVHIFPVSKVIKRRLYRKISQAQSYSVFRRELREKKFKKVFSFNFFSTRDELLEYFGKENYKESDDNIDEYTRKVQGLKEGEKPKSKTAFKKPTVNDILNRKPLMLGLSFLSPDKKMITALGMGYFDENIQSGKSYEYYFEYQLKGGGVYRYPESGIIRPVFNSADVVPPTILKVKPLEAGVAVKIKNNKQKYNVFSSNLYRTDKKGKTVKVNDYVAVTVSKDGSLIIKDENLPLGKEFSYHATSVTFGGIESKAGNSINFTVRSLKYPKPVGNIKVKAITAGPLITWNPSIEKDIIGYNVYFKAGRITTSTKKEDKFNKLNKVLIPSTVYKYTHRVKLKPLEKWSYRVTAVNKWGNESPMSTSGFITFRGLESPSPPVNISVGTGPNGNLIQWDYPKEPVNGFLVYRSKNRLDVARPINNKPVGKNSRRYLDKQAVPDGKYWYTVRALGPRGTISKYPAPVFIATVNNSVPAPPSRFAFHRVDKGVQLYWNRPNNRNLGGFEIVRIDGGKRGVIKIDANKLRHVDEEARASVNLIYRIYSVNRQGRRSSTYKELKIKDEQGALTKQENISVHQGVGKVWFSWPKEHNGHKFSYQLFRKSVSDAKYVRVDVTSGTERKLLDRPRRAGEYVYFIKKVRSADGRSVISRKFTVQVK